MIAFNSTNARIWSKLGSRGTFGVAMQSIGNEIENLMVLTADLSTTSGLDRFRKEFPNKFLNIGIAEQNMMGIAGGLAKEGKNVFATTFSRFNIKVVGLAGGLAMGMFGNTHYGIEDLALMRAVPGLTVLSPADGMEVVKAVIASANYDGPVYIRLTGTMNNPIVYKEDYDFSIGKAVTLREGTDITLIATGTMVAEALAAAKILEIDSISASVVNIHTIKPLDTSVVAKACRTSKLIVTLEEHGIIGGLGGAVAEYKATLPITPPQLFIGLPDRFGNAGEYKFLLDKYGLTREKIALRVKDKYSSIH